MQLRARLKRCRPLVRHTWRVALCAGAGLPAAAALEAAGLPVPAARYVRYMYPGASVPPSWVPLPLFSRDVKYSVLCFRPLPVQASRTRW